MTPDNVGAELAKKAVGTAVVVGTGIVLLAIPVATEILKFIAINSGPLIDYVDIVLRNVSLKHLIEWIKIKFGSGI